ncbi:helix-turn-helix domain-containing protein, partial [Streptococcus dysgalactiae]|uniref:helix-turn-helix domain-containing protein n=1 Tax=Streptococcus dysgalactiae TaxID=1334 RepID=UPI001E382B52
MSNINSTRKYYYSHLSATARGEIAAYHKMGQKCVEIARLLGRHRSTICRALKRVS